MTNKLGIRGVKDVITDLGRQQGVNQVIIQGGKELQVQILEKALLN